MSNFSVELAKEIKIIAEVQYEECKIMKQEILEDAEKLKRDFYAFHDKLNSCHDISSQKSIFKSPFTQYKDCVPNKFDLDKLKELLEKDE